MQRTVSIDSPAVRHGIGLFETMLVVNGRVTLVDQHFERLTSTAIRLRFSAPERRMFDRCIAQTLRRAAATGEVALRVQWLAVAEPYEAAASWRMFAAAAPLPNTTLARRRYGRAVTLSPDVSRSLPFAKTTSWLTASVAHRHAIGSGADEALFVDRRGRILEGTSTNVFAVRGDRLVTAPLDAGILPGIVRAWVIANAPRVGWKILERAPAPADVLSGAFMTGSLTRIAPVRTFDRTRCTPLGERLQLLQRLFAREVLGSR